MTAKTTDRVSSKNAKAKADSAESLYYPTIIISDTHLGKKVAAADMLLEFLNSTRCDTLIMNGDIIDGWHLEGKKHSKFRETHARVIDAIMAKAAQGTRVIYIAGNHDERLRRSGIMKRKFKFRDKENNLESVIEVRPAYKYKDPKGRKYLILHGDQFDPAGLKTEKGRQLSKIGDGIYDGLIEFNAAAIKLSRKYLKRHFSLAAYAKKKTKKMLGIIESFEKAVAKSVNEKKIDGVICGHIHYAEIRDIKGVDYMNSGDWVESCTALVHDEKGKWSIVDWTDKRAELGLDELPEDDEIKRVYKEAANDNDNPNAAYRPLTEKALRLAQRLWQPKDRAKLLTEQRARRESGEYTEEQLRQTRDAMKPL